MPGGLGKTVPDETKHAKQVQKIASVSTRQRLKQPLNAVHS